MAGGGNGSVYEDDDEGGGIISDINVTPLVDITLVLLIIFMVTARLIVNRASLKTAHARVNALIAGMRQEASK